MNRVPQKLKKVFDFLKAKNNIHVVPSNHAKAYNIPFSSWHLIFFLSATSLFTFYVVFVLSSFFYDRRVVESSKDRSSHEEQILSSFTDRLEEYYRKGDEAKEVFRNFAIHQGDDKLKKRSALFPVGGREEPLEKAQKVQEGLSLDEHLEGVMRSLKMEGGNLEKIVETDLKSYLENKKEFINIFPVTYPVLGTEEEVKIVAISEGKMGFETKSEKKVISPAIGKVESITSRGDQYDICIVHAYSFKTCYEGVQKPVVEVDSKVDRGSEIGKVERRLVYSMKIRDEVLDPYDMLIGRETDRP